MERGGVRGEEGWSYGYRGVALGVERGRFRSGEEWC